MTFGSIGLVFALTAAISVGVALALVTFLLLERKSAKNWLDTVRTGAHDLRSGALADLREPASTDTKVASLQEILAEPPSSPGYVTAAEVASTLQRR